MPQTKDGFIIVELTPAFAASMQKLLPSVVSYLQARALIHSRTRQPNDNQSASMQEYCERSADGLEVLNKAIAKANLRRAK